MGGEASKQEIIVQSIVNFSKDSKNWAVTIQELVDHLPLLEYEFGFWRMSPGSDSEKIELLYCKEKRVLDNVYQLLDAHMTKKDTTSVALLLQGMLRILSSKVIIFTCFSHFPVLFVPFLAFVPCFTKAAVSITFGVRIVPQRRSVPPWAKMLTNDRGASLGYG